MGFFISRIANFFMEEFERRALALAEFKPKVWWRFVDDTFVVFSHGDVKLNEFLKHLNSISPSIRLTREEEIENRLAFLDVCVERDENVLKTTVFRKKTHTGQYLNFSSNHQKTAKEGVAYSLFDRAKTLCSNENSLKVELKKVENDLLKNGYPQSIIKKCKRTRPAKTLNETGDKEKHTFMSIPYVQGISEKISRIGRKYNIKTAFRTHNTLRQSLVKTKPKSSVQESKNCVYSIKCNNCPREYVGETKRPLNVRIKEHEQNTRRGLTDKSKIAQHCWEENHNMNFKEACIIHKEPHYKKRKIIEASYMKLAAENNPISQPSVEISSLWLPILRKELKRTDIKPFVNVSDNSSEKIRTHGMVLRSQK